MTTGRLTEDGSKGQHTIEVSDEEHATILAAIRYWQRHYEQGNITNDGEFWPIADSMGQFEPLTPSEIDTLCERINT